MTVQEAFEKAFDRLKNPLEQKLVGCLFDGTWDFQVAFSRDNTFRLGVGHSPIPGKDAVGRSVFAIWFATGTLHHESVQSMAPFYLYGTSQEDASTMKVKIRNPGGYMEPLTMPITDDFCTIFVNVIGTVQALIAVPPIRSIEGWQEDPWPLMT